MQVFGVDAGVWCGCRCLVWMQVFGVDVDCVINSMLTCHEFVCSVVLLKEEED